MYDPTLENELLVDNVIDTMVDYASIQPDIDETKVKAAWIIAQNIDLKMISQDYFEMAMAPQDEREDKLRAHMIRALCYFTYSRCLKMFQGTFTESGYVTETEAADRNVAKSVANEMESIGETYLNKLIDYIGEAFPEEKDEDQMKEEVKSNIHIFGGQEVRESNMNNGRGSSFRR